MPRGWSRPSRPCHGGIAVPDLKVCGLTRPEDARDAVRCGARFVGVIFAGGPRQRSVPVARGVLDAAVGARRVAVVAEQSMDELADLAEQLALDVLQLHGTVSAARIDAVRARTGRAVWAVLRVTADGLAAQSGEIAAAADMVLLEPWVPGHLGGTGRTFDWAAARPFVDAIRRPGRVALAGGLTPINVKEAIAALAPDVVDVSSGVESAPGIKDQQRMRDFARAVFE
jgi:phosphoribosylanthranilate isomerase